MDAVLQERLTECVGPPLKLDGGDSYTGPLEIGETLISSGKGYTLVADGSPVFRPADPTPHSRRRRAFQLFATCKKKRFGRQPVPSSMSGLNTLLDSPHLPDDPMGRISLFRRKPLYITQEGEPLGGTASQLAAILFDYSTQNPVIPAEVAEVGGVEAYIASLFDISGKLIGDHPISLGQHYLLSIQPKPMTHNGEMFDIGETYTGFQFGGVTIAESSVHSSATYCFLSTRFGALRGLQRKEIRKLGPEDGFLGRVPHGDECFIKGDPQKWAKKVSSIIKQYSGLDNLVFPDIYSIDRL